ncbi:hypothetical protein AAHB65_19990 [Bacillus toyonensis]
MSVVGDFNEWDYEQHKMLQETEEGIWSLFIPHIEEREIYKYAIETMAGDVIFKADPVRCICRSKTEYGICSF